MEGNSVQPTIGMSAGHPPVLSHQNFASPQPQLLDMYGIARPVPMPASGPQQDLQASLLLPELLKRGVSQQGLPQGILHANKMAVSSAERAASLLESYR